MGSSKQNAVDLRNLLVGAPIWVCDIRLGEEKSWVPELRPISLVCRVCVCVWTLTARLLFLLYANPPRDLQCRRDRHVNVAGVLLPHCQYIARL